MQKHLIKKKQCCKKLEAYNYSEDQLLILSLLPDDTNNINEQKIDYLKNSNIIYKNKDKLLSMIEYVDKNKLKKCTYCNEEFNKISDLRNHILVTCFYKEIDKETNKDDKSNKEIIINGDNNLSNNHNHFITNNITNNIYIEIKNPVPFDEDWDISKITDDKKASLLISKIMYTGLLEEILKNEINLNIIIDKNNDLGMVYKNNIDQYIQMKSKDIVDNTMEKLRKHLIEINDESKTTSILECLQISKQNIEFKHDNYKNNQNIQENVKNLISKIFEEKKDDALNISNSIKNRDLENIEKGF